MDFELIRGDTKPIKFQIKDNNGNVLKMEDGEEIYFTIKKNYKTSDVILQKKLTDGDITYEDGYYFVTLSHEDTAELNYGSYVYDIQIMSGELVSTLVLGTITLTEEVTHIANE